MSDATATSRQLGALDPTMTKDDPIAMRPAEGAQPTASATDDFDSPWKALLDRWAQPFLEFFFPIAATDIDWSRGLEFLDKELQKVTRKAAPGLERGPP